MALLTTLDNVTAGVSTGAAAQANATSKQKVGMDWQLLPLVVHPKVWVIRVWSSEARLNTSVCKPNVLNIVTENFTACEVFGGKGCDKVSAHKVPAGAPIAQSVVAPVTPAKLLPPGTISNI
ncbi:hypothetical protein D3C71_1879680 [compost metagenome]